MVLTAVTPAIEWQRLDLSDRPAADAAKRAISEICQRDPRATLEHDFDWLFENYAKTKGALNIWLCRHGQEVIGYAPITASPAKLRPSIGERAVASWRVERHRLVACPLFKTSSQDQIRQLTLSLLKAIRGTLPYNGVLLLLGARADSALFDLVCDEREGLPFLVAAYGPPYQRRLIELPDSYEDYFAGLSKKTRANLRRYERKLKQSSEREFRLIPFATADEIESFLDAAIRLSETTYQWRDLGLGLHERARITRQLHVAAKNGWMLCYLLKHGDEPIAYMLGYRYRDTYFLHNTGYHPDWADLWPGNYLQLEIIRDVIERYPEVRWIDFLYGDSFNKRRYSTASRLERNCYLFPQSAWGFAAFASLELTSRLSESAGRLLDRFGAKERLRRLLWRS